MSRAIVVGPEFICAHIFCPKHIWKCIGRNKCCTDEESHIKQTLALRAWFVFMEVTTINELGGGYNKLADKIEST